MTPTPTPSPGVVMRRRRNGVVGPVLLCDGCRKRIADARAGVVLWDGAKQDAAPVFAHVGECCREVEAGRHLDSQPLSAWLIYLCNGARLKWLKAGRLAVAFGSVS